MPLPKLTLPQYEVQIPSSKKKIKFRPFLVKEEKILFLANESEDPDQITNAIKQVLSNCIITRGIKIDSLPTFDVEYLFLNIRAKSVGETVNVTVTCPDDNKTKVPAIINLEDISVNFDPKHSKDIKLGEDMVLRLKYPSLTEAASAFGKTYDMSEELSIIASCIDKVFNKEETWCGSDCTKKELLEFVENLTAQQFEEVQLFFSTMPKLTYDLVVENPETKVVSTIVLEGLSDFLG